MKKLLVLLLFPAIAFAQYNPLGRSYINQSGPMVTNNDTTIFQRTFWDAMADTTEALTVKDHKTLYVNVQADDTTTVLISYALSVDGYTFSAYTLKDSLSAQPGDGFSAVKSVDLTSTILGANYVKFIFLQSGNAYALGTSSLTYTATYTFKSR